MPPFRRRLSPVSHAPGGGSNPFTIYAIFAGAATLCSALGLTIGSPLIAYILPAFLQAGPAVHASLTFVMRKRYLANWIAFGGCFLFFHFQLFSFAYWDEFSERMTSYTLSAKIISVVGINCFPILLVLMVEFLFSLGRTRPVADPPQVLDAAYQHRIFIGFMAIFAAAAVPHLIYGKVVVGAIRQILYMRAGATEGGETYFSGGASSSLLNLQHFSTSLLLLALLLRQSRHWRFVRLLLPLAILWTAGNILGGTRTQLLLFATALVVVFAGDPRRRLRLRYAIGVPAAVLLIAQFASVFRYEGFSAFDAKQFRNNVTNIRGLETMEDQTRAIQLFVDGYRSPWNVGIAPLDMGIGLVYRPIEFALFVVPRAAFPMKPVDPTFHDLNRMVMEMYNLNPDDLTWGITAGIIGRDLLRWGPMGSFVALFWLGFLLSCAERSYRRRVGNLDARVLAGAIAGSCLAMYRDLSPLWCLQMFPAVFVILWARQALPVRNQAPVPAGIPPRRVMQPRRMR